VFKTVIIDDSPSSLVANSTVATGSSQAHSCQWCYKQYVLKNKLLRHQRAQHYHLLPPSLQEPQPSKKLGYKVKKTNHPPQTVNIQFTGKCILNLHLSWAFNEHIQEGPLSPQRINK